MTSALQAMLGKKSGNDLIVLDLPARRLTLRDGVFERGSACLTSEARAAVANVQGHLANFLLENPRARFWSKVIPIMHR